APGNGLSLLQALKGRYSYRALSGLLVVCVHNPARCAGLLNIAPTGLSAIESSPLWGLLNIASSRLY
ncbi:MAG TPA: hypothetical protein VKA70_01005, partial [Blastocatellia bacterium]|nr:hypothetical protein [Blastocatellia bacterium]